MAMVIGHAFTGCSYRALCGYPWLSEMLLLTMVMEHSLAATVYGHTLWLALIIEHSVAGTGYQHAFTGCGYRALCSCHWLSCTLAQAVVMEHSVDGTGYGALWLTLDMKHSVTDTLSEAVVIEHSG